MSKVRDLPEQTNPEDTDLLYTVDDSEGVNGGKKIKLSTLRSYTSAGFDDHLNGDPSKHDASEIDYERDDLSKTDIEGPSDSVDTAIDDLDNNKLSINGNNVMAASLDMDGNNIENAGTIDGTFAYAQNDVLKVDIGINSDDLESAVIDLDNNKLSRNGNNTMAADLDMGGNNVVNVNLVDGVNIGTAIGNVQSNLDDHLDGTASKHDGSEIDYERSNALKTDIEAVSVEVESAISDLDDNKLSRVGNNTMGVDLNMGGFDITNVGLVDGRDVAADGAKIDSIAVLPTDVFVSQLSDFPAPVAGVITLEPDKTYNIGGAVDIGTNRIVVSANNAIVGKNPQLDRLIYSGTVTMFTVTDVDFILTRIGISCDQGVFINATNIDYAINPTVDGFQGRNKRLAISFCNLIGGIAGNGSIIGEVEGFSTVNFNGNLITGWDDGFKISNGLSFESLNNKSVLWNGQGNSMIILRDNNWSNQTGGAGSYIPTGFNALNFNGNVLHPRTADYAVFIEEGHSAKEGNVSGNIFITTGTTTGGVFDPNSLTYNDLPEYNIQGNQGIQDNVPTIQATIDNFTSVTTVINAVNTPVKLNFNNTIKTSQNLLFSSRILVNSTTGFEENQIITGGTSGYIARIQSIDIANNYLYVEYVVDAIGNNQYFTVGESLSSTTASATYNGVDGSFKYYGNKDISIRFVATMSLQKEQNGADLFSVIPYLNGVPDLEVSAFIELDSGVPLQVTVQDIQNVVKDDVIELYIENKGSRDNVICQSIVWNLSGR
jgi:hypothetical protein